MKPQYVAKDVLICNTEALREYGRRGAKVRVARVRARARKLAEMIREAEERALEAHEDICPVDD